MNDATKTKKYRERVPAQFLPASYTRNQCPNARKMSVRITKKISYNANTISVNNLIIIPLPIQ